MTHAKTKLACMRSVAGLTFALTCLGGAAQAQEHIDWGSQSYYGGNSSFGGYYDTYGANGGFGGNSGFGTYRRQIGGASTTAETGTILSIPLPGGAETSNHCRWLKGRADTTHKKIWRQRYAACLQDYK